MELCSIRSLSSDKEFLWHGDPQIWNGQAPILFPIIGLLKEERTIINGLEYAIPKHGIVRHSESVTVSHSNSHSITFVLSWNEETLKVYPFKFELEVTFSLEDEKLNISHLVRNVGDSIMHFHLGGHPAFNCPVSKDHSISDYHIQFEEVENSKSWLINGDGLITDKYIEVFKPNSSMLQLTESLFDDDALIFRDLKSTAATLASKKSGPILRVDYSDFPYLGIWAKPNAPYVCIEPWFGIADHENADGNFLSKEILQSLEPGSEKIFSYSITILE